MNKQRFILEVWEQKTVSREKITVIELPTFAPVYPVGATYVVFKRPMTIIDSISSLDTVINKEIPVGGSEPASWEDVHKQIIVLQ